MTMVLILKLKRAVERCRSAGDMQYTISEAGRFARKPFPPRSSYELDAGRGGGCEKGLLAEAGISPNIA